MRFSIIAHDSLPGFSSSRGYSKSDSDLGKRLILDIGLENRFDFLTVFDVRVISLQVASDWKRNVAMTDMSLEEVHQVMPKGTFVLEAISCLLELFMVCRAEVNQGASYGVSEKSQRLGVSRFRRVVEYPFEEVLVPFINE